MRDRGPLPWLDKRLYGAINGLRLAARDVSFVMRASVRSVLGANRGRVVLCNSYPKSGTHLLFELLSLIPGLHRWPNIVSVQSLSGVMNRASHIRWKLSSVPSGSIARSHLTYSDEVLDVLARRDYVRLFVFRDLRDVAVSHAHWVQREPRFYLHSIYRDHLADDNERLMASIVGVPLGLPFGSSASSPAIGHDFARWQKWLTDPQTLSVRFEDLVGKRGGGDDARRLAVIRQILSHVGVSLPEETIARRWAPEAVDPSHSYTFRRGVIGGWREVFTPAHEAAFKAVAGKVLIDLGYEKDDSWSARSSGGAGVTDESTG